MPNQSGKVVLVLFLLLAIGFLCFFVFYRDQVQVQQLEPNNITDNSTDLLNSRVDSDFYSKNLNLSLKLPTKFRVEEKPAVLKLTSDEGEIEVVRNSTEYNSLEQYIDFYDSKRDLRILNKEIISLDRYEAQKRKVIYVNQNQLVSLEEYVYMDGYVYIFSTSDEALYPVLDQIVRSFEYKP